MISLVFFLRVTGNTRYTGTKDKNYNCVDAKIDEAAEVAGNITDDDDANEIFEVTKVGDPLRRAGR